jgi:hypothetical protein
MMEILEHHDSVASALHFLCQVRHMGDGTLVVIDQRGDMAVFEASHVTYSIRWPDHSFVVSTNHFCSSQLGNCWIDRNPPELQGNSQIRNARVTTALEAAGGQVDATWAQALMADHGGSRPTVAQRRLSAICRHSDIDPLSTTVSTALYLPRGCTLVLADGQPCQAPFQAWLVI